jgi:hypothetical protein
MHRKELEPNLSNYLDQLSRIPNAPFLYHPSAAFVKESLSRIGFSETAKDKSVAYDDFAIYARVKKGNPKNRIIITTHLDHPFLVLNGKGSATPLGSIGNMRLKMLTKLEPIPIEVFSSDGEHLGQDSIIKVKLHGKKTKVLLEGRSDQKPNSHGIWSLKPLIIEGQVLKMLAADDVATTSVVFSLLEALMNASNVESLDVEVVFNYLEEIRQVSATGIALRNKTPLGEINKKTLIVPLEADYTKMPQSYKKLILQNGFSPANYSNGLILRVNDLGLVYGQNFPGPNLAENLLLQSFAKQNINHQQTIMGSSCDGTSFTLFSNTPHIAGLTIPTRYKHNHGPQGEIVHEEILLEDLINLRNVLLEACLVAGNKSITSTHPKAITTRLKETSLCANKKAVRYLRKDRIAAFYSSLERIKRGKFFPETPPEKVYFYLGGVIARGKRCSRNIQGSFDRKEM